MTNLTPEKRNQLVLLGLVTLVAILVVYSLLLRPGWERWQAKQSQVSELRDELETARERIENADAYRAELISSREELGRIEENMAQGDMYLWIIRILREFQIPGRFEFTTFDPPRVGELNLLPKVPNLAVTFSVVGTGYYHDFGEFLAEFENRFPYVRLQRIHLEPAAVRTANPEDQEKLGFRIEFVALVKPGAATP